MIHKYYLNGLYIVLDVNSGSVHVTDETTYKIVDRYKTESIKQLAELCGCTEQEISEIIAELRQLEEQGLLYSKDSGEEAAKTLVKDKGLVKALCLHIAHSCNLRCAYCFAGDGEYGASSEKKLMSFEVGKAAIDFLIVNSASRKNLEVDFFGGEPLLNFEVVKQIVEYAKSIENKHGKTFRFTITTNGLLLDDEKLDYINKNMNNIVLSIDGRKETNDKMRYGAAGTGCYDDIVPIFQKTAESRHQANYYVRGTFTAENLDFSNDVLHLASLGFKQISVEPVVGSDSLGYTLKREHLPVLFAEYEKLARDIIQMKKDGKEFNFFHYMIDLTGGPCLTKRITGCGAGTEYLAVSPNGDLYPCHQFTGVEGFLMGSVFGGVSNNNVRDALAKQNVYSKPDCRECFAKFYCSGGCAANAYNATGDFSKPYELGCELQRKRVECALMIKADEEA